MEFNGTFLATILTFILFVFVMNKILYAPILEIMEKRKELIDSNYKKAEENDLKAEEINNERIAKLDNAKNDAKIKYIAVLDEFKEQKISVVSEAQQIAKEKLDNSRTELKGVSDEIKNNLKGSMNNLANDITEKIIGYRSNIEGFDDSIVNDVLWGGGE